MRVTTTQHALIPMLPQIELHVYPFNHSSSQTSLPAVAEGLVSACRIVVDIVGDEALGFIELVVPQAIAVTR